MENTMSNASETVSDRIARLNVSEELSDTRIESLSIANPLVDDALFVRIAKSLRVSRKGTVTLPAHRYEGLSRGRGWCRQGRGSSAVWGERVDNGYQVGPGRWIVGGNDGFSRKGEESWNVEHIEVGDKTWTIAS